MKQVTARLECMVEYAASSALPQSIKGTKRGATQGAASVFTSDEVTQRLGRRNMRDMMRIAARLGRQASER